MSELFFYILNLNEATLKLIIENHLCSRQHKFININFADLSARLSLQFIGEESPDSKGQHTG